MGGTRRAARGREAVRMGVTGATGATGERGVQAACGTHELRERSTRRPHTHSRAYGAWHAQPAGVVDQAAIGAEAELLVGARQQPAYGAEQAAAARRVDHVQELLQVARARQHVVIEHQHVRRLRRAEACMAEVCSSRGVQ